MKQNLRRQKLRKGTMNIGIWNVQGISNKMDEVISSLEQQVGIAFPSETKRKVQGNENRNYYEHFWSGVNKGKKAKAEISILKLEINLFTSGHSTVGGEEEDRNNYGGTK